MIQHHRTRFLFCLLHSLKQGVSGDFGQGRWIQTAVPSLLPTSVDVLRKKRERSGAVNTTSTSPGLAAGSIRAFTDLKMSVWTRK